MTTVAMKHQFLNQPGLVNEVLMYIGRKSTYPLHTTDLNYMLNNPDVYTL